MGRIANVVKSVILAPFWPAAAVVQKVFGCERPIVVNILGSVLSAAIVAFPGWALLTYASIGSHSEELPRPCSGEKFCILLAGLEADQNDMETRNVMAALDSLYGADGSQSPVEVVVIPSQLHRQIKGVMPATREIVERHGRELLSQLGGNLLLYGRVAAPGQSLGLGIVLPNASREMPPYALENGWRLPPQFDQDLGAAISLAVALSLAPQVLNPFGDVVPVLTPAVHRLAPLIAAPKNLTGDNKAVLFFLYGMACERIASQSGDSEMLQKALAALNEASMIWTEDTAQIPWAQVSFVIANIRAKGSKIELEEAISLYRRVVEVYSKEERLAELSVAKANLGDALVRLGMLNHDTAYIDEGERSISEAVDWFAQNSMVRAWGIAQYQLGQAFVARGRLENAEVLIKFGINAVETATRVLNFKGAELGWARAKAFEGEALYELSSRRHSAGPADSLGIMSNAVVTTKQALLKLETAHSPIALSTAQLDLGREYGQLALWYPDNPQWSKEAAAAFQKLLESDVFQHLSALERAPAENDFAYYLATVGEKDGAPYRLQRSVEMASKSVTIITSEVNPAMHAEAQETLARAQRYLGKKTHSKDMLIEAKTNYEEALEFFERSTDTKTRDIIREGLLQTIQLLNAFPKPAEEIIP